MEEKQLLMVLKERFDKNINRHPNLSWESVLAKLKGNIKGLKAVLQLELTGGEPDVVSILDSDNIIYVDCCKESPTGRRSLCYDNEALEARKANKPLDSAINLASKMGVVILNEEEYRKLQEVGQFDLKTSSWIITDPKVRALGGALFCDRRYDQVFTYHNGADSYYGARGFRAKVKL